MANRNRKTLPKNFEELLRNGDLDELKAVFDGCELDARGGVFKQTALAFSDCPDQLTRWLVSEGADIHAEDSYGKTPLHSRAQSWRGGLSILLELGADVDAGKGQNSGTPLYVTAGGAHLENARVLIQAGADVNAADMSGETTLQRALKTAHNANMARLAPYCEYLISVGAKVSPDMEAHVRRIGQTFEFHRSSYSPEGLAAADAALNKLYDLFAVEPLAKREFHDGKSAIDVPTGDVQSVYDRLWQFLVPSSGPAETVQGEVIRIAGRVINEVDGNGGINWRRDFRKMLDAFRAHVSSGRSLSDDELSRLRQLCKLLPRTDDAGTLGILAVEWVKLNPQPVKLAKPKYKI